MTAYFAGDPDDLDLRWHQAARRSSAGLDALRGIEYGSTKSYGQIASEIGSPRLLGRWVRPTTTTRSPSSCRVIG